MDERRGCCPECESTAPFGFRRSNYATRDTALDGQHSALEISEPENGELSPSGPRVSGQTHEQEPLLGTEETALQPGQLRVRFERVCGHLDTVPGRSQDLPYLAQRMVPTWLGSGRATHAGQRIRPEDALTHRPGQSRAEDQPTRGHRRHRLSRRLPPTDRRWDIAGCQRHQAAPTQRILDEGPNDVFVRRHGGGVPQVWSGEEPLQQLPRVKRDASDAKAVRLMPKSSTNSRRRCSAASLSP